MEVSGMNKTIALTDETSTLVERLIKETTLGSLTFIVQDSHVIQLERHEKYQFSNRPQKAEAKTRLKLVEPRQPVERIQSALAGIQLGQVVVKVQAGRIVQIDRTEKQRLQELMGVGGDGI